MGTRRVPRHLGRNARVVTALALVVGTVGITAPPAPAAAPAITVTPNADLTDFSPVQVTGTGYDGYERVEAYQCRGGAVDEFDCDAANAFEFDVALDGTIDYEFYVDGRIFLPSGEAVDCRTDPASCVIGIGFIRDADEWPQTVLDFDPSAPLKPAVTATLAPDRDLEDGQVVTITGQNLSFREETFAYVCIAEPGEPGRRCDLDRLVRGVAAADGTIELELPVWSSFFAPLAGPRTCGPLGDECEVVVSWSFFGAEDRRAEVPISFADPTPEPTVPTTAPSPPPQPRPAPPAVPVASEATFTG